MKDFIFIIIFQLLLLLFLLHKDKNDGEKELFRKQRWKTSDVLIIVLLLNVGRFAFDYFSRYFPIRQFVVFNPYIFHLFLFILVIVFFKFLLKHNISDLGFRANNPIKIAIKAIAIGSIVYITYEISYWAYGPDSWTLNVVRALRHLRNPGYYISYFFAAVVCGPFVEEVIFRGILYSPYRKKYGAIGAIILTSLFFSAAHSGYNLLQLFLAGVFLGLLYEKTESILSNTFAHGLANLLSILTGFYLNY